MADRLLNELAVPGVTNDGFTLEQGGGVLILEFVVTPTDVPNAEMMTGVGT